MTKAELVHDYERILLSDTPLLDVRAPVEFQQGAFPYAANLPLMNDDERHAVGIEYKVAGQAAAIKLGHQLVKGPIKTARVQAWADFVQAHPDAIVYCFRGGLRSQIAQQWLAEAGYTRPRIAGGYKAMRQFLIDTIDTHSTQLSFVVIGGLTGCGKTDVIAALQAKLNLEGLANHRGSSFGGRAVRQPSQIDFENMLAIEMLRQARSGHSSIAIEDESHLIGRCAIPLTLRQKTQQSPIIWLTAPLQERVQRIQRDYIETLAQDYVAEYGQQEGLAQFQAHLTKSLFNLRKRLGLERYATLEQHLRSALKEQFQSGSFDQHQAWIEPLLTEYYDPMYTYQRQQKTGKLLIEGDIDQVIDYLRSTGH